MTEVASGTTGRLTPEQFHQASGVEDWRVVGEGACACFRTGSFPVGARLVQAISGLSDLDAHHPDVDVRHDAVTVRLVTITPDHYGLTGRDVELARRISAAARDLGIPADPSAVQTVQVTVDALVGPDVLPFWRALLDYTDRPDSTEDLIDPRGRGPMLWFQTMDAPRPQRNRMHIDVWVPYDRAGARIAAALAAGGRLVSDAAAPSFWVLADAEGNEACVGTAGWIGPS
ncbi:VOC family protein [Micromonospora sp. NPDC049497]|uniref:VOC family protein n=1 Tax=Micromonospora sp. NPDC049497 TaxID=3364273 RepID=UPI0037943DEA